MTRAVLVVALLLVSSALAAQETINPAIRDGLYLGAGAGYGSTSLSCGICRDEGVGGVSGYLRVGTAVRPNFLAGAELTGWLGQAEPEDPAEPTAKRSAWTLFGVAHWYPFPERGLYLKGGLGFLMYRVGGDDLKLNTVGGTLGLGYEIPVSGLWSVVPYVHYVNSFNGGLSLNDVNVRDDASISIWQIGLGVTRH